MNNKSYHSNDKFIIKHNSHILDKNNKLNHKHSLDRINIS